MPPLISNFRLILGWLKELFWMILFLLHFPAHIFFRYRNSSVRKEKKIPIVIVPDFLCSFPVYLRFRRMLVKEGFQVYIAGIGNPFFSLRKQAEKISSLLNNNNISRGILIGHGMGGLVALSLPDSGRNRINHFISIGAPMNGSRLYLKFKILPPLKDMSVNSSYLLTYKTNAFFFPLFSNFIAYRDQWILPFSLAFLGPVHDMVLDQVGRFNLVLDKENLETIVSHIVKYRENASANRRKVAKK